MPTATTAWRSEAGAAPSKLWPKPLRALHSQDAIDPTSALESLIHVQALPSSVELPVVNLCLKTELGAPAFTGFREAWGVLFRAAGQVFVRGRLKCLNGVKWDKSFYTPVQTGF